MNSCRNILQDEAGHLKVTDFGLSKIAQGKDADGYKMTGETGSCMICFLTNYWNLLIFFYNLHEKLLKDFSDRYMAPEVYRRESYGKSVDVFSFALIVHEVKSAKFLFLSVFS